MKSQPNVIFRDLRGLSTKVFLLFILSLFLAANAEAKKPQPEPGPSAPDNVVIWGGDAYYSNILEDSARLCTLSEMASDETSGAFSCELNNESILYDFTNLDSEPIHRRGDDWRCTAGTLWAHIDPDMGYSFSWNGNCAAGCGVTIVNAFSNYGAIGGSVGKMTIEGFATATSTTGGNPFAEPQSLLIDYLHVTLFGVKGKNKVIAKCKLTPDESNPIMFETSPVPIIE